MEEFITFASWMSVLGVPSVVALFGICIKYIHKTYKSLIILHNAQKAQMRRELMEQYDKLMSEEKIESAYFDEFKNQYKAYHNLVGDNEVLDDRYKRLIEKYNTQNLK